MKEEKIEKKPLNQKLTCKNNATNSLKKNSNFKVHNYGKTDYTKFHNQSKDVLYIAKRLQQVNIILNI